ncbi:MAG TPA: N-acetylmuramoyl-L-alanine amidase [Bryobacteraceae bacterium]|jgi:N-acetylmuramoyl-L-alanine amidase
MRRSPSHLLSVLLPAAPLLFCIPAASDTASARVEAIRFWSFGDVTRVAIETEGDYKLYSDQIDKPPRVYFDLTGLRPPPAAHRGVQTIDIHDRLVKEIRVAEIKPGKTRLVFDLEEPVDVVSSQLVNPDRLMVEIRPRARARPTISLARSRSGTKRIDLSSPEAVAASGGRPPIVVLANSASHAPDVKQAEPSSDQVSSGTSPPAVHDAPSTQKVPLAITNTPAASGARTEMASAAPATGSYEAAPKVTVPTKSNGAIAPAVRDSAGDRSLVRVLGLKLGRVIIDPGHGGHDTGTIGPNGLMEKDLVLDVALRLGKLITQRLGAEVVYTRSADVFIPLEQRTRIANNEKADLFISIHANSSPERSATGVETFYFNLTSDKVGLDLATRENASSASSISDLNDLLHKAVLENKLEESREFAQRIQAALSVASAKMNTRSRNRGVRQAPFVVLIGASMPSILTEIGFVSNPHDERLLKRADQRQRIADALLKGIEQYGSTLSHVQVARSRSTD